MKRKSMLGDLYFISYCHLSLAFLVYLKVAQLLLRGNCRKPSQRKTRLPILYAMHFLLAYTTYIYICKIYVPFVRKCKMHGHIRQTPTLAGIFKGKSGPIFTYKPRVIFFFASFVFRGINCVLHTVK